MNDIGGLGASEVSESMQTPAYLFDEATLVRDAKVAHDVLAAAGASLLFAMKSCSYSRVLMRLSELVEGFHASSLFEAKLAREILGQRGLIHVTTPAFTAAEMDELCAISDMISLNSMDQWGRFKGYGSKAAKLGLRVNPELSLIQDERYDPCRRHSKLGAPIYDLHDVMVNDPERLKGLTGLLVHSNSESRDFRELRLIVQHLDRLLSPLLRQVEWINLGGGYLYREGDDVTALHEAISLLRTKYNLRVYMEPGASISREAGRLVATVLDVFQSGGKSVAVLDASVNHVPEMFELQIEPDVEGDLPKDGEKFVLAGATCLAGDIFGEYGFTEPLVPGSRVILKDVGAYSMVKAHTFNGVNLPAIYWQSADGECTLQKTFSYDDFKTRCGA